MELSDEELVVLVKERSEEAFRALLNRYGGFISFYSRKIVVKGFDYEDLRQEGRLALLEATESYNEEGAAFATYFSSLLKHRLMNLSSKGRYTKREHSERLSIVPREVYLTKDRSYAYNENETTLAVAEDPVDYILRSEKVMNLEKNMEKVLSIHEMDILRLLSEGYDIKVIAKVLGKTEKFVYNAMYRTKDKLKKANS